MRYYLGRLKLRHQLALLLAVSIFMMILVQIFYYYRFYLLTQQRSKVFTANMFRQVEEKLVSDAANTKEIAYSIAYDANIQQYASTSQPAKRQRLLPNVNYILSYPMITNKDIYDVLLLGANGSEIGASNNQKHGIVSQLIEKYDLKEEIFNKPTFSSVVKDPSEEQYYFAYMLPFFATGGDMDIQGKIGVCIILYKIDYLQALIKDIVMTPNSLFLILDGENQVTAATNNALRGTVFSFSDKYRINAAGEYTDQRTGKLQVQSVVIPQMQWQVCSIIPVAEMTEDMKPIRNFGWMTGLVMAILLLVVGVLFSRNITRPIAKIINFMGTVAGRNLHQRLDMADQNEIGVLSGHVNSMLDSIEEMTRRIVSTQSSLYEMELAKKQAELSALQSQINPHFLYNTLECIRSIGHAYDSPEIIDIAAAMAKIFRYSIKGSDVVNVREEIECIRDYMTIMNIRYKNKFTVSIQVEDELLECSMLKMILQPIIENAVYHGLEGKLEEGHLWVTGSKVDEGTMHFEVRDDGVGMEEEELEKLNMYLEKGAEILLDAKEKRSIGVCNIHNRIRLYHGKEYGLKIFSKAQEGTWVLLVLPVIETM